MMGSAIPHFQHARPVLILAALGALTSCTRSHGVPGPLVVVEGGNAAASGLQPGDVLLRWTRGESSGQLSNPFDLYRIEQEESTRGAVAILGRRGSQKQSWAMGPAPWSLAAVPGADAELGRVHREAARLLKDGKPGQAAEMWEQQAGRFPDSAKVWLQIQATKARAAAGSWKQSDAGFEAARKNPAAVGGTLLRLNREWAESLRLRGEWEPAKDRYEKALNIATELKAELIQAGILYDLGAMFNDRRRPRDAFRYLEKALAIRERVAPDTREVATVLNGLGQSLYYQVQLEKAEPVFQRALAIGERLAPNSLGLAATLQNLGLIAMDRDQSEQAKSYFNRSMDISAHEDPDGILWSLAADGLGTLYRRAGDLDKAEPYQERVLEIRRKLRPGSLLLAACLNNLANLHRARGNLTQAEAEFRESLAINQKLAPATREVAGGLHSLGTLAHSRKEWKLADAYYREAAELWEKLALGSIYWAGSLVNLAQVLTEEGNFPLAEQTYRKALTAPEWQKRSPLSAARAGSALAEIYHRTGRLDQAASEYAKSFSVMQEKMPGSLDLAEILSAQADIAQQQNKWAESETLHRKALAIRAQLAPSTSDLAESLYALAVIAQHARRRNAEAERLYVRAIEALEAQTARVGGTEMTGPQFRAGYLVLYEKLIEFLVGQRRYPEAFRWVERSRGRVLLDLLVRRDLNFAGIDPKLVTQIRANAAEYSKAQSAISGLSAGKDGNAIGRLQSRLLQLNGERAHLLDQVRETAPRVSALRQPVPLTYEQARSALDPGTILISFLVGEQRTILFLVQSPAAAAPISVVSIPVSRKDLEGRVNEFRNAVKERDFGKLPAAMKQARSLYDVLLQPVERILESGKRLLIIPDGPLHGVSFAALRRANNAYLVEWKPLHTAISATLYSELKRARKAPDSYQLALAAFGDADYGTARGSSGSELRSLPAGGSLTPLPFSRAEIEQIAKLFGGSVQLNLGAEATEERARQASARILHFALHGLLDEQNPLNSALVLSLPKKAGAGQEDGFLQAWELYESVHWDTELVVLSACESGAGQAVQGEGLMSLTRAIHFAGARSVLSTLWGVDDRKTTQLMTAFYKNLRAGKSKDEALRAAQTEMISSQNGAMPFYWAGFTLNGDWQ